MDRKLKIYLGLLTIAIFWLIYMDASKKDSINWFPSFAAKDKIPYGTYVLRNELPDLFPKTAIRDMIRPPYLHLKDSSLTGTYFFLNNQINYSEEEFESLLNFVERGNDVFISTLGANVDTMNLKTRSIPILSLTQKIKVRLVNKELDTISREIGSEIPVFKFTKIDTLQTEVLGKVTVYDQDGSTAEQHINFVRQKFGNGYFYFHLNPFGFTNYYLLKEEHNRYISSALSYLDGEKPILWDAYYKTGKSRITSPMYYVLNSKSLKWAYYTALIGILLFVLFQGKRNQRPIPIITPLKNQTIAFAKTIAGMYYEKSEHNNIAKQNSNYFLEYIRSHLNISTNVRNDTFYEQLAAKSGNPLESTKKLFQKIEKIQSEKTTTKQVSFGRVPKVET